MSVSAKIESAERSFSPLPVSRFSQDSLSLSTRENPRFLDARSLERRDGTTHQKLLETLLLLLLQWKEERNQVAFERSIIRL